MPAIARLDRRYSVTHKGVRVTLGGLGRGKVVRLRSRKRGKAVTASVSCLTVTRCYDGAGLAYIVPVPCNLHCRNLTDNLCRRLGRGDIAKTVTFVHNSKCHLTYMRRNHFRLYIVDRLTFRCCRRRNGSVRVITAFKTHDCIRRRQVFIHPSFSKG